MPIERSMFLYTSRKPLPTGQGPSSRTEGGTPASLARPLGDG
nr:MAG TPA: hypothetical protein [Caudoviricetes sp.]